ncbi:hypothetical protein WME98_49935 [Sorangium sp. So ce296]|uniref:hypothetical protein n=1 Tax=Sorangium sp. So ce296 TaxID=3133296 RepID=UPI003F628A1D
MPMRARFTELMLTNSTPGFSSDGTGQYTISVCRVAADVATVTPLAMTLGVLARTGDAVGDSGIFEKGEEFAFQIVLSGTVTNSPTDTELTAVMEPVEED